MDSKPSTSKRTGEQTGLGPAAVLKKRKHGSKSDVNFSLCLICQKRPSTDLRNGTDDGKKKLVQASNERQQLGDIESAPVIERLKTVLECSNPKEVNVKWHKACYSNFTHKGKLERLRKQAEGSSTVDAEEGAQELQKSRRSDNKHSIDWNMCMFCQKLSKTEPLHQVSVMSFSDKIISLSKKDVIMRVRLANSSDLVASEGKYHRKCGVEFERKVGKLSSEDNMAEQERNTSMDTLCINLLNGLARGCVYDMGNVWERYVSLCEEENVRPQPSYISRRSTFYDAIKRRVGTKAGFSRVLGWKQAPLLYPSDTSGYVIAKSLAKAADNPYSDSSEDSADDDDIIPQGSSTLQELVHTALKVRMDLKNTPGHSAGWGGIDQDHIDKVIPESLHLFLSVLFGGVSILTTDEENDIEQSTKTKICSIAQDIVYGVSNARKVTPKHVGLGLTLHQATRSDNLVELFHAAGHTIGMDTIRRIDTTIADDILHRYEQNGYVYIPDEIVPYTPGRIVLASCDNIDVLEETIDGKNTFHCTQMMLWQRGPAPERPNKDCKIGRSRALKRETLNRIHELDYAKLPTGSRPSPVFHDENNIAVESWFAESDARAKAKCINDAWLLSRMKEVGSDQHVPSWSGFNEVCSKVDPPVTTPGMLPILQAPADDNNTMTTVINRFTDITKKLGQKYTVIVADQPLYSRAKEIIWANQEKYDSVVMMMGGLHILFNFMRAIGQHYENSGLDDIWVESGLFAQNSVDAMMNGKAYYRAVRAHTLTYEAISRIRWEQFLRWLKTQGKDTHVDNELSKVTNLFSSAQRGYNDDISEAVCELIDAMRSTNVSGLMQEYDKVHADNPNYLYWKTYLDMVEILLDFIRADRDGNWDLHLDSFTAMLPYLTMYDHTNYARWAPVYLAEMRGLEVSAPEVYREFVQGNFVIKRSRGRFNQVSGDHATEWQNRMCKVSNGIIGITRNDTARDRFCVTWSERSNISHRTKVLFNQGGDEEAISTRKDFLPGRMKDDDEAVQKLTEQFKRFNVFRVSAEVVVEDADATRANEDVHLPMSESQVDDEESRPQVEEQMDDNDIDDSEPQLITLTTNDVATADIQRDLLTAQERGRKKVCENVKQNLVDKSVPFFQSIQRNNSKTFSDLYKADVGSKPSEKKTLKADRKLIQQLFNASVAGRKIQMSEILKHELSKVPLSLAKINGKMNSPSKADILTILCKDVDTPPVLEASENLNTCVLIDGQALVQALRKPSNCSTFDDYAEAFLKKTLQYVTPNVRRLDVVFDTYIKKSIKATTREKRGGKKRPIRKIIEDGRVPLPKVWSQFIALNDNKSDLARFLSQYLMEHANLLPTGCELVTGGGFEDQQSAKSSMRGDLPDLKANHEEADTRLILHTCDAVTKNYNRVLVVCKDTDVLLLLLHFFGDKDGIEVWMISGTKQQGKCYPVHLVAQQQPQVIKDNVLGFHSLTGCDSTSSFSGSGKKSCWKIFEEYPHLLAGVGKDGPLEDVEEFVCRLYGAPNPQGGVDQARHDLFERGQIDLERLPPTKDALQLHTARCNYQAKVWLQSEIAMQTVGTPQDSGGWRDMDSEKLDMVWSRIPPVPQACIELITCGCQTKCQTANCKCYKNGQRCMPACKCRAQDCCNPVGLDVQ